jgi:hypothetical protein
MRSQYFSKPAMSDVLPFIEYLDHSMCHNLNAKPMEGESSHFNPLLCMVIEYYIPPQVTLNLEFIKKYHLTYADFLKQLPKIQYMSFYNKCGHRDLTSTGMEGHILVNKQFHHNKSNGFRVADGGHQKGFKIYLIGHYSNIAFFA